MRFYSLILLLGSFLITLPAFAKSADKSKGSCAAWQEECSKSKNPKACFPARCGAWGEHDYSNIDIHEGELNAKPAKTTKKKQSSVMSCNTAFTTGRNSPSTGEVADAADICESATQKVCAKKSDGTGDGSYLASSCMLKAAYHANMAANKNKATPKCEKAYNEGTESASKSDVEDAFEVCQQETQAICAQHSDGTGDGRLIAASCMLGAAHGGYIGVTMKEKPKAKADAGLCGGEAAPRICKGNCYVNYRCVNDKWERSPIESCALCGDGLKIQSTIDIHEGESKADSAE